MPMFEYLIAIAGGIALLVWSADRFVIGAAITARYLNVSPLVIGLVIMGFGTSAPEMMVSSLAAFEGSPGIGIGNAIGSNIANIALVLGTTALIMPIAIRSEVLRREFPVLLVVTAASGLMLLDRSLDRLDGILLFTSLLVLMTWLIRTNREHQDEDTFPPEVEDEIPQDLSLNKAILWTLIGLILLLISSRLIVWAAVEIAHAYHVSELIIGLTIIAIGTSLPELAASITAAFKQEHDMAIGNIIGSNLFNTLAVLALPGIILPSTIAPEVLTRDYLIMALLTVALYAMSMLFKSERRSIGRIEGVLLLGSFLYYLWILYREAITA